MRSKNYSREHNSVFTIEEIF